MKSFLSKHHIAAFVIAAYSFTFIFRIPLAASAAKIIPITIPRYFQFLGDFGPMLAAILLIMIFDGSAGLRSLFQRVVHWKVSWIWYLVAVVGPFVLFAFSAMISMYIFKAPAPTLSLLGHWEELPNLTPLITWVFLILTIGLGEEVGWRGYMLPKLQMSMSALTASVLTGIIWIFWHIPSFIFDPQFSAFSLVWRLGWGFLIICASIIYAYFYNSTGGSLLIPILFHGTNDYVMGSLAARDPVLNLVWAILFIGATVTVLIVAGPQRLSTAKE